MWPAIQDLRDRRGGVRMPQAWHADIEAWIAPMRSMAAVPVVGSGRPAHAVVAGTAAALTAGSVEAEVGGVEARGAAGPPPAGIVFPGRESPA